MNLLHYGLLQDASDILSELIFANVLGIYVHVFSIIYQ